MVWVTNTSIFIPGFGETLTLPTPFPEKYSPSLNMWLNGPCC